ncbi:MAG: signal peptidase I [Sphingobacteriales bacterium 50-39]|nr:signal peptidase I [Sphingobacteriales bacterium]OJW55036.1 MAG: signal peptidase I [Sphingobacteriales bacterium 50-39]
MSTHQLLVLVVIQLLILLLPSIGLYKMFEKAGAPGWKAFVPFYNTYVMLELAERPKHWVFWQLIPVVGWFISMGIYVEFVKAFGKFRFYEHALAALVPVLYFPYLGYNKDDRFLGSAVVKKHKKGTAREWVDAGVFAIVAATLIRTFVFEAYTIPTGSMEKTLLINDFLFVSKFSYGPRIPNTPLSIPFVHNTMPITNGNSYVEWIKVPYTRWFSSPVKRGDVVVFNFPAGDTVINLPEYQSLRPYYDIARQLGQGNVDSGRQIILSHPDDYPLVIRPVDKQENYIKRCVAVSGDTLQIKDQVLYIDGQAQVFPPESQTNYDVETKGQPLDETVMKDEYNLDMSNGEDVQNTGTPNQYDMLLTWAAHEKMLKNGLAKSIVPKIDNNHDVYPYDNIHVWSKDNYGPIWIPAKGATLPLTKENYTIYERAIRVYEGNKFEMKDGKFYLNDQPATQYTFKMNYYWMMGDNRHGSQDSRYWGFVPEDHVVGEAWLIWMSWNKGVRWNRLFKKIK